MSPPVLQATDDEFPCSIKISIPFPTSRLAETALRALQVDEELSPLVKRSLSLTHTTTTTRPTQPTPPPPTDTNDQPQTVLRAHYRATTNRMLRVSVNGFFESIAVVLQIMEELDVDVLALAGANGGAGAGLLGGESGEGVGAVNGSGKLDPSIEIGAT